MTGDGPTYFANFSVKLHENEKKRSKRDLGVSPMKAKIAKVEDRVSIVL